MSALLDLSRTELARYSRHLLLPEIGLAGQRKLKAAKILIVGAGGLGSPSALYLAAAGVGTIGIVDDDVVDASNLQRQVLHSTEDVAVPKVESAKRRLSGLNPQVEIVGHGVRLSSSNAFEVMRDYDVIIDGTDNFPTRYLANDASILLGKPYVYGSIYRFEGQASVLGGERAPCYRCLFPQPPPPGSVPSCAQAGVLGVLPGVIGMIQATEALKLVTGVGETLEGRLLLYDALEMRFRELKISKDPNCPLCGLNPTISELVDYDLFCGAAAQGDSAMQDSDFELTPAELKAKLERGDRFELLDVRDPDELEIVKLDNTKEIPIVELGERMSELAKDSEIVAYCLSGGRSERAVRMLRAAGFANVKHLAGGIRAWVDEIDPSLPRY